MPWLIEQGSCCFLYFYYFWFYPNIIILPLQPFLYDWITSTISGRSWRSFRIVYRRARQLTNSECRRVDVLAWNLLQYVEWWDSTTDNVFGTIRKYWIWLGRTTTTTYLPLKPVGMLLYAHLCVLLKTQLYLLLYVCYRKYIYQLDRYCILLATTTNLLQSSPQNSALYIKISIVYQLYL